MKRNSIKKLLFLVLAIIIFVFGVKLIKSNISIKPKIGIAWASNTDIEFYKDVFIAIKEAGGEPVVLDKVVNNNLKYENENISSDGINENNYLKLSYANIVKENKFDDTNVKDALKGVDAVVFSGGEDISPTLYKKVADWHQIENEKDYNATRDVSDYILMSYCIDNDIPVLCLCRGMQLLAIVSGGEIIQDISTYFSENNLIYNNEHRKLVDDTQFDFATHDINIIDNNSIIYDIFGNNKVENVLSWHHQAVKNIDNTNLKVTAVCNTNNYNFIEAIERIDKTFILGLQFHPEITIAKKVSNQISESEYMDYINSLKIFSYFIEKVH